MTLCLAESLAETNLTVDVLDQVGRYIRWYRHGHLSSTGDAFDVGPTTRMALEAWEEHFEAVGFVRGVRFENAVCTAGVGEEGEEKKKKKEEEEEEEEVYRSGQKKVDDVLKRKVSSSTPGPFG